MTCQSTEPLRTAASTATTDRRGTITTTYRRLRILGFDECEAGNLTAYVSGIAIGSQPWTVRELTHLLFMREMYRVGRRWSNADDRTAIEERRPPTSGSKPRDSHSSNERVTLLTFSRGVSRLSANQHPAPPGYRSSDAPGHRDREGG